MKSMQTKITPLRCISAAIYFLCTSSLSAETCGLPTAVKEATIDEIGSFFEAENKDVVTFVGYSGSEYENKQTMLAAATRVLDGLDSSNTIVNIGATPEGIGAVYAAAKEKGFITTGIVSTQAKEYDAALSDCVDYVFYVEDEQWGGIMEDGRLSPTSTAMVANSDVLIGIGGGKVARDELSAAEEAGKKIQFIPADMNHRKAREKALNKGLPVPESFGGAADEVF